MKIFKRVEVWLLLILAVVAMLIVFKSTSPTKEAVMFNLKPAGETAVGALTVQRLSLVRDFGNARLDIDVHLTNPHAKKLQLVAPTMKLTTGGNHAVPEFFLPVEPPPEIPAKTTADAHLRYWLEKADLAGKLILTFEDQTVEVKSAKPFDLEKLKNDEPKTLPLGDWN